MFSLFALGLTMGFAFVAPPGLITAETFRRGLLRGWWAALAVQLGSLVGDVFWAVLALAGLAILVQNPLAERTLALAGAFYLLYSAGKGLWSQWRAPIMPIIPTQPLADSRGAFAIGAWLSLSNPWAVGYWLGPGGALAASGALGSWSSMTVFFLSFFGSCVVWAFWIAWLAGGARRALPASANRWLTIGCHLIVGWLGVELGYKAINLMTSP